MIRGGRDTTMNEATLRPDPKVSIVLPVFNEEEVIPLLLPRLRAVIDQLAGGAEVWFVDDGSVDGTARLIERAHAADPRIKLVQFSRNFGHAAAITAGLDHARGEAVVLMDGDLQDPPELILEMVARYREGFDVVQARRVSRREDSFFKRITAWLFYRMMGALTHHQIPADVGEFRLMSHVVVAAVAGMREHHRLIRGMVHWVGFCHTTVEFDRPARAAGRTKYPLSKMLRLSVDGVTSFSTAPLRAAGLLGFLGLLGGLTYAGYALYERYILGQTVRGWTSLVLLNVFFSSVVLICLGVVGEYVGRIFEEVKNRPLYLVLRTLDDKAAKSGPKIAT
jgi:glycosyltransferase involved in cell wall biosynthesis